MSPSAPVQQRLRDGNAIVHRVEFESLAQCAAWAGDMSQPRWKESNASHKEGAERTRFAGTRSFAQAMKMVTKGWKEGRSKMVTGVEQLSLKKDLLSAPSFVYDVAGARPEVPLAVAGDPCCMWDANPLQDNKAPVLRFVVEGGASCQWGVDQLIRWGTSILSVVDSLESTGSCSVELRLAISIISHCGRRKEEFITTIKKPGHHIDFDVMAFAIAHPSMLRRIGFGCCERIVEDDMESFMGDGYGRPSYLSADALDGAYHVPSVNFSGISSRLLSSDIHQEALFNQVMNGFRRLVDGLPFCEDS